MNALGCVFYENSSSAWPWLIWLSCICFQAAGGRSNVETSLLNYLHYFQIFEISSNRIAKLFTLKQVSGVVEFIVCMLYSARGFSSVVGIPSGDGRYWFSWWWKCLVVTNPLEIPFVVSEHLVSSNAEFFGVCMGRVSFGVHVKTRRKVGRARMLSRFSRLVLLALKCWMDFW